MSSLFVEVRVEEHDALPDGCCLRWKAQGQGRVVSEVRYEAESGTAGLWAVEAASADGARAAATAYPVDDSSAGTSTLIVGGDHGLRLTSKDTGEVVAEPYLLLAGSAVGPGPA